VAEAVKKALDLDVDRRALRLVEPLKMTGAYTVDARLEKGIVAQVRLEIEEE
jgi:ribosomal protein L9